VNQHQSEQRQREATDELNDVAAEVAQAAITVITAESILEQIPIAKVGLAIWKTVSSIRDQLLMKKLEIFLRNLASVASEDRRAMVRRLNDDPTFKEDVGDHIVELLDRIDGQRKPAMIGAVFAAFARSEINVKMLRRLNNSVERLSIVEVGAVRSLANAPHIVGETKRENAEDLEDISLQALLSAGLAALNSGYGGAVYSLNPVGIKFVELNLDNVSSS
jgi:hypothetical protein